MTQSIRGYFLLSFFSHCFMVGALILISKLSGFWDGDNKILEQNNISIITTAVRVDVVAMPKMTLQELKKINISPSGNTKDSSTVSSEKEVGVIEEENKDDIVFEKEKKKQNFLSLLKDYSKKDTLIEKTKQKKNRNKGSEIDNDTGTISSSLQKEIKGIILAGNKLSQGSSAYGEIGEYERGLFGQYVLNLPDIVRPEWKLPSYLLEKNLQCRIRIYLNNSGELIKAEVFESSGNVEYDTKAMDAVKKSAPFPRLPKEIQARASRGDILLGFPL